MDAELIFAEGVHSDVSRIYGWYEDERPGLGEKFFEALEECYESIIQSPRIRHIVFMKLRRAAVRGFPYAVYYEILPDTILIQCIIHTARGPEALYSRLK